VKNEELDEFISRSLDKLEIEVPAALQADLRRRAAAIKMTPRWTAWKRVALWASLSAAAVLLAVISLPLLFPIRTPEKKITQIRTEFSIPEKNIRIVWVQRDDFRLPAEKG
jgi:hypothetical protein